MDAAKVAREVASLPADAQREIIDFVAFLKARYPSGANVDKAKQTKLTCEPFVGMWRDRDDMRDSTAWVRHLRQP